MANSGVGVVNVGRSSTQIIGSILALSNSNKIVLCSQSTLSKRVSLYGLDSYYNDLLQNGKYLLLSRESSSDAYLYKYRNSIIEGFDLVIYLDSAGSLPLGFTEFFRLQGTNRDLVIYPNFTNEIKTDQGIGSTNDLYQLRITDINSELLGDENYNFTSVNKVLANIREANSSYTSHVSDLSKNKSIVTSTSGITSRGLYSNNILKNKDYDPLEVKFDSFAFSKEGDDIMLLEWKESEENNKTLYASYYMTRTNNFGNPLAYTRDTASGKYVDHSTGYCTIEDKDKDGNSKPINILSSSGRYILVEVDEKDRKIYDTYQDSFIETTDNLIIDERSISTGLIKLGKTYDDYVLNCPDILNLYKLKEIQGLFPKRLKLYRKIGSWFIFEYDYSTYNKLYLCASPVSLIYLTKEDLDEGMFILNDNTILLKKDNYYVMYSGYEKTFYSEKARLLVENGIETLVRSIGKKEFSVNVVYSANGKEDIDKQYKSYYENGDIIVISKMDALCKTVLNKYRRNSYPEDIKGIPDIIGCFEGIIFYKKDKTINYL